MVGDINERMISSFSTTDFKIIITVLRYKLFQLERFTYCGYYKKRRGLNKQNGPLGLVCVCVLCSYLPVSFKGGNAKYSSVKFLRSFTPSWTVSGRSSPLDWQQCPHVLATFSPFEITYARRQTYTNTHTHTHDNHRNKQQHTLTITHMHAEIVFWFKSLKWWIRDSYFGRVLQNWESAILLPLSRKSALDVVPACL